MAIFTPSESPAIVTREIDLTGVVPNVQSTTGAIVGNFRWGPVEQATLIADEAQLVSTFAAPNDDTAVDFLSAAYFLRYSGSLQTIRVVDSDAKNAVDTSPSTIPTIKNLGDFDNQQAALDSDGNIFIAKYPGDVGNSLQVSTCPYSASDSAFDNWAYSGSFDTAPGTSSFASGVSASNDEIHVAVIDQDGLLLVLLVLF